MDSNWLYLCANDSTKELISRNIFSVTDNFSFSNTVKCILKWHFLIISEEFVAHGASVNCLALGHKSGRVLVTGGDDKKVNLWAVGKPNCIMVRKVNKQLLLQTLFINNLA